MLGPRCNRGKGDNVTQVMLRVLLQAWCLRGREQEKAPKGKPEGETQKGISSVPSLEPGAEVSWGQEHSFRSRWGPPTASGAAGLCRSMRLCGP